MILICDSAESAQVMSMSCETSVTRSSQKRVFSFQGLSAKVEPVKYSLPHPEQAAFSTIALTREDWRAPVV